MKRLSRTLHAEVQLDSISRKEWFSFSPTISLNKLRILQPAWAGRGDFVRLESATLVAPVYSIFLGDFRPRELTLNGLHIALVRSIDGRSNWAPNKKQTTRNSGSTFSDLSDVSVTSSTFSLDDQKRNLTVTGFLVANKSVGMRVTGRGMFMNTPAQVEFVADKIVGMQPNAPHGFSLRFNSPALSMTAQGKMAGILDVGHFTAGVVAQAPTLKNLDRMIEAGLFGTQPVRLSGTVRHDVRDWYIEKLSGQIGRSRFVGKVTVLKHDDRTAIDGVIHAAEFDFSDLSDNAGRARAAALTARIGERAIPNTRINLSKIGRTDGIIRFKADRLLFAKDSMFKTLAGSISLDHRVVTLSDIVAGLRRGQLTGSAKVDHRQGAPKLMLNLRFGGAALGDIIGKPEMINGSVKGRILLTGYGDTFREAISGSSGRVAMVASGGTVKATVANVLGQDLGRAIGQQIKSPTAQVPLRCLVASFRASHGILIPDPVAMDASVSTAKGTGRIVLSGETVALSLRGQADRPSGLGLADPVRVGGTLLAPSISVAGLAPGENPNAGSVIKLLGRSIKAAIGIGPKSLPAPAKMLPTSLNCSALTIAALK
jgi:AsmA family protein